MYLYIGGINMDEKEKKDTLELFGKMLDLKFESEEFWMAVSGYESVSDGDQPHL